MIPVKCGKIFTALRQLPHCERRNTGRKSKCTVTWYWYGMV